MIIDTHTHFGDPARPNELLFRTEFPEVYKELAIPEGITGTVITESVGNVEGNQWALDQADKDPFIVGLIGFLDPFSENYSRDLDRFAADPRFCGFRLHADGCHRYDGDPVQGVNNISERLLENLAALVEKDLAFDVHGEREDLDYFTELYHRVNGLRVVLNHFAGCPLADGTSAADWNESVEAIRRAAKLPNAFCKVSALGQGSGQSDPEFYREALDVVWNAFGADRLIYGSNWPQIEVRIELGAQLRVLRHYFSKLGDDAQEKLFWKNAKSVYKWPAIPPN
jgi:L-fuconolactonase